MPEPSTTAADIVRFGLFELNLRSGELRKAGTRINLQEQPFRVLTILLDRPGDLVTRDELRERLWPGDTFVDFEHGLNAVVNRLRDTLGDSADSPRFIETVPRRGSRFIAGGAPPRTLVPCVRSAAFATAGREVFYVACSPGSNPPLHALEVVTGRDRLLGNLEHFPPDVSHVNLAVSPDGAVILFRGMVRNGGDLMLVENFR